MDGDSLREALENAQNRIALLDHELKVFYTKPIVHATVVEAQNELDPTRFLNQDLVVITEGRYEGQTARVVGGTLGAPAVDENGYVTVMFPNLHRLKFQTGLKSDPQVKLLNKNDGTNVTVTHAGNIYEVWGVYGKKFERGQTVKVNLETKQIVEGEGVPSSGDVCFVKSILDDKHLEVDHHGTSRVVINGTNGAVEANDRVQLDSSATVILRHMGRAEDQKYILPEGLDVSWDDIGGCTEAKDAMIEAIELPFMHPEIFKHYNVSPPKGVLLYGPPGCGKTMMGKAAATSLCKRFGKDKLSTGFIYVKGPELLNMWLGNTEQNIREIFHRGRKHWKRHGVPALIFIDEAEAILPQRGARKSSDAADSFVPMFLSEMDGLEESHTIVVLATNRPDMLDPAAVRAGRIDRHIKVPRPDVNTAAEIFRNHLRGKPLVGVDSATAAAVTVAEMFSKHYVLYKLSETINLQGVKSQHEHVVTLKDCVNGAMIAGLVNMACNKALRRDLSQGTVEGATMDDFRASVDAVYHGQVDQNHSFDLEDFIDTHRINKCELGCVKVKVDGA